MSCTDSSSSQGVKALHRGNKISHQDNKSLVYGKRTYLEVVRIIAIMCVVFNHTAGFFMYANARDVYSFGISLVGSILCRVAVPLFLMVSGATLLGKRESIGRLLKHRVLRMMIVLAVFSAFYYAIDVYRGERRFSPLGFIRDLLNGELQSSFWYIYLYIGILLLMPLLRILAQNMSDREYTWLIIIVTLLAPIYSVVDAFTDINVNGNLCQFNLFLYYVIIGYGINEEKIGFIQKRKKREWCLMAATAFVLTALLQWLFFRINGAWDVNMLDVLLPVSVPVIFELIKEIVAAKAMTSDKEGTTGTEGANTKSEGVRTKAEDVICTLGSLTFGIYLLEHFGRIILKPVYQSLMNVIPEILAVIVYWIGSIIIAGLCTYALKKLPKVKEYL